MTLSLFLFVMILCLLCIVFGFITGILWQDYHTPTIATKSIAYPTATSYQQPSIHTVTSHITPLNRPSANDIEKRNRTQKVKDAEKAMEDTLETLL